MRKFLFFALALVAGALAFTSCEGNKNNPDNPQEQEIKPADLIGSMWRTDSVFINNAPGGPHAIVEVLDAQKAVVNGDTAEYSFKGNILNFRGGEIKVSAYTGKTAILSLPDGGPKMYMSRLPEWDMQNLIMNPQTEDFVGTWKLAYYTMNSHTIEGEWNTMGTNPGVETWELRADGTATYHSTFFNESENGTWSYEYGMIMVKNPAQSHLRDENDRITVQPLTKNWMGFVRGEDYGGSVTYYQWYFVRVK